jgi:hypothetical protein
VPYPLDHGRLLLQQPSFPAYTRPGQVALKKSGRGEGEPDVYDLPKGIMTRHQKAKGIPLLPIHGIAAIPWSPRIDSGPVREALARYRRRTFRLVIGGKGSL